MRERSNSDIVLVIVVGLLVLHWIFDIRALLTAALIVGIAGIVSKSLSRAITQTWMRVGSLLGRFNAYLLLSVVFFVLLTPLALIARLFGQKPLNLEKRSDGSYYVERQHDFRPEDLRNPW